MPFQNLIRKFYDCDFVTYTGPHISTNLYEAVFAGTTATTEGRYRLEGQKISLDSHEGKSLGTVSVKEPLSSLTQKLNSNHANLLKGDPFEIEERGFYGQKFSIILRPAHYSVGFEGTTPQVGYFFLYKE